MPNQETLGSAQYVAKPKQQPEPIKPTHTTSDIVPGQKSSGTKKWFILLLFLLPTICIISILSVGMVSTYIAVNPAGNFEKTRDAERQIETQQIISAMGQYMVTTSDGLDGFEDKFGNSFPNCLDSLRGEIYVDATASNAYEFDMGTILVPEYLAEFPEDPLDTTVGGDSGYTICSNDGFVHISAPMAETGEINSYNISLQ